MVDNPDDRLRALAETWCRELDSGYSCDAEAAVVLARRAYALGIRRGADRVEALADDMTTERRDCLCHNAPENLAEELVAEAEFLAARS